MTDDRFDLVLFGVTGYTGELALAYLAEVGEARRGRVAVAGRDRLKVADACRRLAPNLDLEILVADAEDQASLEALCARTRVLAHLAGPYAARGPRVVDACVAHGTHYVDLCGEPLFVRDMIALHHERARAGRTRIVHAAGYESLPFDMLTLLSVDALRRRGGGACQQVDVSVKMHIHDRAVTRDAALSGGTVATILLLLEDTRGADMVDPAVLLPAQVDPDPVRARHPMSRGARWDDLHQAWAVPVFPAPTLNPQVILRSAALCAEGGAGYGPDFTYRECATMAGSVEGPPQQVAASTMAGLIGMLMGVIEHGSGWQRRGLGKLVRRFGAQSGQGPRHELLDSFDYTLRARATGDGGRMVSATWHALGNPGYRSTAKMVVQAALALAFDGDKLPAHYGILTPATALGTAFKARLPAAGVTLTIDT